jgi:hypothetical protein
MDPTIDDGTAVRTRSSPEVDEKGLKELLASPAM